MAIVKVADKQSWTFHVDLEACPWAQTYIDEGELRVLSDDEPLPGQVIDETEANVCHGGSPPLFLVDFSRPPNWPQAEKVSAAYLRLVPIPE